MSTNLYRNNDIILRAERAAGSDRYGQPLRTTVGSAKLKRVRLSRGSSKIVGVDGVTTTIDGTMMVAKGLVLVEGDKLTMKDSTEWEIFNVDESLDINGSVLFRTYGMTKQRKKT